MTERVQVGRIGRPHGLRGSVTVAPTTDDPADRFAAGSVLDTEPAERGPLTVAGHLWSGALLVVAFAGVTDRTAAEALRGTVLSVTTDQLPDTGDEDDFYDHQLVGLAVLDRAGTPLGRVVEILHPPAAPVLVVDRTDGGRELVPFVAVIVPVVDLLAGTLTVHPPDGMFT